MSKPGKVYQPKGRMCITCKRRDEDCSNLEFKRMPVIERAGSVMIVRCKEWSK